MTDLVDRIATHIGGRYALERELGRGGMATVYLARDLRDERRVAIKVMDPDLAAAVGAERFKREIDVASRLVHPNILGILDSGEAAGTSYYVMPYVSGETLRARLEREKQLPIEDAIRIAREVADALDYAHKQGIVHRDIKPENILLEHGRALVADFGIARAATADGVTKLTKTGTAMGTPHYMSPEQIFGEKDIDGRTDQYALGCMLHEMLAGQPPFVGPHAQSLMAQHALDEPPLVSRFRPSTPSNVEDAIYTALAKTRADRFATLEDFHRALENSGYTSLMKITRMQRATSSAQALVAKPPVPAWRRGALALGALALVVALLGGGWKLVSRDATGATRNRALTAEMQRIAVLYFDADGQGDVAAYADGLTEDLIARLRGVKDLTVASRDAVTPYRGQDVVDSSIATALGVGTLVTGSIEERGDRLFVKVELRDRSGTEIDEVNLSQPLATAQALRDSIAERVTERLRVLLGDHVRLATARSSTANAQAWTLLQRGERARREADSLARAEQVDAALERLVSADALFEQAASLDARWSGPAVSRASTALMRAEFFEAGRDRRSAATWLDSAEAASTRALALEPDLAEAFAARGRARSMRVLMDLVPKADAKAAFAQAAADLDTATSWDPTHAAAWWMRGRLEYAEKRPERAKFYTMRAYEADAFLAEAPQILYRLFITSHDLNNYDEAKKYCDEGGRRFPNQARFVYCRLMVHMMEGAEGVTTADAVWRSYDSLKAMVDPARWPVVGRDPQMFAAAGLVRAGLPDSARRVMERARVTNPKDDPTGELLGLEAFVLAQLGEREAAVRLIERYVADHPQHIAGFRQADFWWWRPLRDEPRFKDILELARKQ